MKPELKSRALLGMTRSKAKMFEYDVPENYHINITQDPGRLFTLSIGILGDVAARSGPDAGDANLNELTESLQFSARFFDAYMQAKLNAALDPYLMLLGAASFYLCDLPGSSVVLAKRLAAETGDLGGQGLGELLRWTLQGDLSRPLTRPDGAFSESIDNISTQLREFFREGRGTDELFAHCDRLRRTAYDSGTPRQLLLADVVRAVVMKKHRNSSWYALPEYTGLPQGQWLTALTKRSFIQELWPAQHLLGTSGVLRGRSALVQMPTSAGKTKATELIIRSAFLSGRTSLAVIVAPFRALCHEIRNSFVGAFRGEGVNVDELSDVLQGDFEIAELLASKQVLVVTPEKFVYVLRHTPALAEHIGVLIFDEGHQFDSGKRGITYELLITSLKSMIPATAQKILISAVISNASVLGEWLNGPGSEIISGTKLVPTFRTVGFASWTDQLGRLEFVAENNADEQEFFVPRVIEQLPLQRRGRERKDRVFPDRSDGQSVALLLGLKLVKNGAVAIFCGRKTTAANLCERAVDVFERKVPLIEPLAYSDRDETTKLHYLHVQNLGPGAGATRSARIGIFSHHANIPHGIRLAVEHAMREGSARFVICTSTLAQGVNLPIRYLLVPSIYQGEERIKVRDFHNLIGRAGRAGMHTEGSILFADPDLYDNRRGVEAWRWDQVKQLLEPANSEPCISALLSFFDPLHSDDNKYRLALDAMDFVKRYVNDAATLTALAEQVATEHADKGFTRQGLSRQIAWKIDVISSVESFLMSHWDTGAAPLNTQDVVELAKGTLAYFSADAETKQRIIDLFSVLAENVGQKVGEADRRRIYSKTLYGLATAQEFEQWVRVHLSQLRSCTNFTELLELVWPLLTAHIQNDTFAKCSKPEALKDMAQAWISGRPFSLILDALQQQGAQLTWGKTFRDLKIDHIVEMCEGGLAYDGSLLVGAIVELINYVAPDSAGDLTGRLQVLQKTLKYGLPSAGTIAIYEVGFSDRVVAAELSTALGLVDEGRRDVLQMIRQKRDTVVAILEKYPSYFTHIVNDVL